MEWMLDSANLNEVRESLEIFPICGVTTNPTILRAEGRIDYAKHLRELRAIVGSNRTFHVQAGVDGCENIVREAQRIHEILGKDVYIKGTRRAYYGYCDLYRVSGIAGCGCRCRLSGPLLQPNGTVWH